jgi:hypothetical protein
MLNVGNKKLSAELLRFNLIRGGGGVGGSQH